MLNRFCISIFMAALVFAFPIVAATDQEITDEVDLTSFEIPNPEVAEGLFKSSYFPDNAIVFFLSSTAKKKFNDIDKFHDGLYKGIEPFKKNHPVITVDFLPEEFDEQDLEFIEENLDRKFSPQSMLVDGKELTSLFEGERFKIYKSDDLESPLFEMKFNVEHSYLQVIGEGEDLLSHFLSYLPKLTECFKNFSKHSSKPAVVIFSDKHTLDALCNNPLTHASSVLMMPSGGRLYLGELAQNNPSLDGKKDELLPGFMSARILKKHVLDGEYSSRIITPRPILGGGNTTESSDDSSVPCSRASSHSLEAPIIGSPERVGQSKFCPLAPRKNLAPERMFKKAKSARNLCAGGYFDEPDLTSDFAFKGFRIESPESNQLVSKGDAHNEESSGAQPWQ